MSLSSVALRGVALRGVDLDDARTRLVDDTNFLLSLLREFVRHAITVERALVLLPTEDSLKDARSKLHQLRGGAANLAAHEIAAVALTFEQNLKNAQVSDWDTIHVRLTRLRLELRSKLHELRDSLRRETRGMPGTSFHSRLASLEPDETPKETRACVLIIDDSEVMRTHIRTTLLRHDRNLEVLEAEDGLSGYRTLIEREPDLAICDLEMPAFDGLKFLSMLSAVEKLREIPVVMVTAQDEMDQKAKVLACGAADYITKPFHGKELLARTMIHLEVRRLKAELSSAQMLLATHVLGDPVTGLLNQRGLEQKVLEETERTIRYGMPLSLALLSLRNIDSVRKQYGVHVESAFTECAAKHLVSLVRMTDRAGRFGSDGFGIVLPHTEPASAKEACERVCRKFSALRHSIEGAELEFQVSIGVAGSGGRPITARELNRRAYEALSQANRNETAGVIEWAAGEGGPISVPND